MGRNFVFELYYRGPNYPFGVGRVKLRSTGIFCIVGGSSYFLLSEIPNFHV